jgi:quinol-cytochrome oxidoreductase complex cytochrome b subunit
LYAILRSIPNKVGGLVGFGLALILLLILAFVASAQKVNQTKPYGLLVWRFIFINLVLM